MSDLLLDTFLEWSEGSHDAVDELSEEGLLAFLTGEVAAVDGILCAPVAAKGESYESMLLEDLSSPSSPGLSGSLSPLHPSHSELLLLPAARCAVGPPTAKRGAAARIVTTGIDGNKQQGTETKRCFPAFQKASSPLLSEDEDSSGSENDSTSERAPRISSASLEASKKKRRTAAPQASGPSPTPSCAAALPVPAASAAAATTTTAPVVDWRTIEDPAERRRQRRLAKNRMTAARSRERRKVQFVDLETRLDALEKENKRLRDEMDRLARENAALRGVAPSSGREGNTKAASAAPVIYIYKCLLLCLISFLFQLCCATSVQLASSFRVVCLSSLPSFFHASYLHSSPPMSRDFLRRSQNHLLI